MQITNRFRCRPRGVLLWTAMIVTMIATATTANANVGSLGISRRANSLSNQLAQAPVNSPLLCDLFQNISRIKFAAGRRALVRAKESYLEQAYDVGDCNMVGHEGFFDALKTYFGDITQLSEMADGYAAIAQKVTDNGECSIEMMQQGEAFQVWKRLLFGVSVFAHLPRCSQDPSHLPLLKEAVKYPPPRLILPQCEHLFEHCYAVWEDNDANEASADTNGEKGVEVVESTADDCTKPDETVDKMDPSLDVAGDEL